MEQIINRRYKVIKKLLRIVYYLSFLWVSLLLFAEIMVLITSLSIFYKFLNRYFFTAVTLIAIVVIVIRFIYIMVYDLLKSRRIDH